jgi:hypothetical protein
MNHVPFPANLSKCDQSRKVDEWNENEKARLLAFIILDHA